LTTMKKINRRSTAFVDLSFLDENERALIPTAATGEIHDRDTGTVIRAPVALTAPLAADMTVWVTEAENEVITATSSKEVHVLTIEFDYVSELGAAHGTGEFEFMVTNLIGVVGS